MAKNVRRKIVIHAGFHKTGTSTLQEALHRNETRLGRDVGIFLKPQMKALCEAARGYSVSLSPVDLGLVQYEAAVLAETFSSPVVLLSSEDLCGHMPGRLGIAEYTAAPAILQAILQAFTKVNKRAETSLFFTTRTAMPWLRSCHAQNIRASRQTLDRGAYAAQYAASARLDEIVTAVRTTVEPHVVVSDLAEDAWSRPTGALGPMLALAGLDDSRLVPVRPRNETLPDPILAKLLKLNRSDMGETALRAAKQAVIEAEG